MRCWTSAAARGGWRLHLAKNGHRVMGIDPDPELVRALAARAASILLDLAL